MDRLDREIARVKRRRLVDALLVIGAVVAISWIGQEHTGGGMSNGAPGERVGVGAGSFALGSFTVPDKIEPENLALIARELSVLLGREVSAEKVAEVASQYRGKSVTWGDLEAALPHSLKGRVSEERAQELVRNINPGANSHEISTFGRQRVGPSESDIWNLGTALAMCSAVIGIVFFVSRNAARREGRGHRRRRHRHGR